MADEPIDTPMPPAEPGKVAEPVIEPAATHEPIGYTNTGEPIMAEPQAPVAELAPTPPPPPPLTPEEIEERAFQRMASWSGRREKEFADNILTNVTKVIESRLQQIIPQPPAPDTTFDPAALLDNPKQVLRTLMPEILREEITRQSMAERNYNTELVQQAGRLMDSDPLFEDRDFGAEVIAELQKNLGSVDRSFRPDRAAKELVYDAAMSVTRRKMLAGRTAPLAGNKPSTGIGTITPPAVNMNKLTPVVLDAEAKKVAAWFGNTDEEIRTFLK